uniref:Uncharacterized protein n=1 Tax=Lynx canadensis TaxID=61383 RepID=A0A667GY33_LYNCA
MFQIKCLMPKLEPKDVNCNMLKAAISSLRNFLICSFLLQVTPFILKKLDNM